MRGRNIPFKGGEDNMKGNKLFHLLSIVVVAAVVLAACGGTPTPTEAPPAATVAPPTTAPVATTAPEATAAPAGCPDPAGTGPVAFPDGGKSVVGAWDQEPNNINPYYTVMSFAIWITQFTLVGLAEWDENGNFVPELATEIPSADNGGISPDGLTITWKLKDCLYWSDGERLTADDVVFTWESIVDPANTPASRSGYDKLDSVTALDELTVELKFSELYPPWQTLFTQGPNNSGAILPKHLLEGKTGLENDPEIHQPTVSSGPFIITEWVSGDHLTLLPNPNFYKGRPILDQIQIKFLPESETILAALQTGDVDWYANFAESDMSTIAALEPAVHLIVVPGADFEHYFFNMATTAGVDGKGVSDYEGFCPFKDVNVRKAIIMGIDRFTIVDTLLEGNTIVPAHQWPNSEWDSGIEPYPYDPDQAMALLDEAGYTDTDGDGIREGECNGETVKLSFNFKTTTAPLRVDVATIVQQDLAAIGVEYKPEHLPAGTWFGSYAEGGPIYAPAADGSPGYDLGGYTTGFYPDPWTDDYDCDNIPNAANGGAGDNGYHICDPALDEKFDALNATVDPAARKTILADIQQYIHDNAYVAMMYARANVYGHTDRFVPGPFGFFSNMNWNSEVWDVK
jgi:peptide/nickel transport system substrate-binding protein